jgi:hypothetical protein
MLLVFSKSAGEVLVLKTGPNHSRVIGSALLASGAVQRALYDPIPSRRW